MISIAERWEKLGVIKAMANQAADKFANTADNIFRNGLNGQFLESIARQTITLQRQGINTILVGSGARAVGDDDVYKGQIELLENWRKIFDRDNFEVGELLLTGADLRYRGSIRSYILIRALMGRIMLINGDDNLNNIGMKHYKTAANNDRLAGYIADVTGSDRLILLTNVDGVFDKIGKVVERISSWEQVKREIKFRGKSVYGMGSMKVKVESALRFVKRGINRVAYIANGNEQAIVERIVSGEEIGTRVQI